MALWLNKRVSGLNHTAHGIKKIVTIFSKLNDNSYNMII